MSSPVKTAEDLFHAHTNLAYSALRFYRAWLWHYRDDLTQVAMLGLWEAVNAEPTTDFVTHCRSFINRALGRFVRSELKVQKRIKPAFVSRETKTNEIDRAPDCDALESITWLIQREKQKELDKEKQRLNAAIDLLPDHRKDLLNRFASGKLPVRHDTNPNGHSITVKVQRMVQFLRDEVAASGSGDLSLVVQR